MSMTQQVSIPEMINQSREIMTNPSVATFERYERHGNVTNAAIYVAIAAAITGILNFSGGLSGIVIGLVNALLGFFVFTGLVYFVGQRLFNGTGNWDEVAYTFSLFWAPLAVVGGLLALLGAIPFLGFLADLASFVVLIAQVYFGYIAVQSSMNFADQGKAIGTLALAFIGTLMFYFMIGFMIAIVLLPFAIMAS
jgi:hypothetical protein